ncbi:MAG TPA: hypothetical protein VLC79_11815 [Cellvibrio sp.]|nr:hypothetical protein [Cellvibrio sp.]
MSIPRGLKAALAIMGLLFLAFLVYGFTTDCPNTAGYFFCSESERRDLRQ